MKKVMIYALSTCPWCRRTKQFFRDRNIAFECIEYDLVDENKKEKISSEIKNSGAQLAFPFTKINDKIIVGYNPEKFAKLMETDDSG